MKIEEIFEQTSSDWVKYTNYEIIEKDGKEWITPTVDAKVMIYSPISAYDTLIQDMLNAGRLFSMEEMPHEYKKTVLEGLIITYGLMGFMTAIPLNGNFMEQSNVFLGKNPYFDVDMMETKEYLKYFQPFGIKQEQFPALLTGKTLEYGIVFSRNYAEPVEWIITALKQFYTHFSACKAYENTDNPAIQNAYAEVVSSFVEYGLGFQMKMYDKPTMVWDFNSLKAVIETVYAVSISSKDTLLRMCRQCGKAFYAQHGRSEFCSGKCRNQFNVYKFREKQKEKKE